MAATALSSSISMAKSPETQFLSGSLLKPMDKCFLKINSSEHFLGSSVRAKTARNLPLIVRAGGDGGRPSGGSIFVGGFVLGGIIVGALGCAYAPQISRALAGADSKDIMRKLPKFMYDEEKALEGEPHHKSAVVVGDPKGHIKPHIRISYSRDKTRKVLTEKIAQLSSAIDGVSAQLRTDEGQNESAANSEETEASIYE